MEWLSVAKVDMLVQISTVMRYSVVGAEVILLIFHRAPEMLNGYVVPQTVFVVHADLTIMIPKSPREIVTGELIYLIHVHYLGLSVSEAVFIWRPHAEVGAHGIRQSVRQDLAGDPVKRGDQRPEAKFHWKVSYIYRPDLVGSFYDQLSERVWVGALLETGLARIEFAVECVNDYAIIQPTNLSSANLLKSEPNQHATQSPNFFKEIAQMQLVQSCHQRQIFRRNRGLSVIRRRAKEVGCVGLPAVQKFVGRVIHLLLPSNPAKMSPPSVPQRQLPDLDVQYQDVNGELGAELVAVKEVGGDFV